MERVGAVAAILLLGLGGLLASNTLRDHGAPRYVARAVAPVSGGVAYLLSILWLDAGSAVAVSAAAALTIVGLKLGLRKWLRGVTGDPKTQAWGEITYPVAGTLALAIGWGLLGQRWLAYLPIAFMAFGDSAAGVTRAALGRNTAAGMVLPSAAMFAAAVAVALCFQPRWIGVLGAAAATGAEGWRPLTAMLRDDNGSVALVSLVVMAGALWLRGAGLTTSL